MNLDRDYGTEEDIDNYNKLLEKYNALLRSKTDSARDEIDYKSQYFTLLDKYNELIYAVERKFEGESRHQTALKYIRAAEQSSRESSVIASSKPWVDPVIPPRKEWNATPIVPEPQK